MPLDPMCIAEIRAAAAHTLDEAGARRLADEIETRAALYRQDGLTGYDQSVRRAGRDLSREAQVAAAIEKRNRAINVQRRLALDTRVQAFTNAGLDAADAVSAINVGSNQRKVKGGRPGDSVDARGKAYEAELVGRLLGGLRKEGVLRDFARSRGEAFRALELDVARELYELRQGGTPGRTGNETARKIAGVVGAVKERGRGLQNGAGAAIGKLEGHITRQSHDMRLLRRAGFEQWYADIRPELDRDRILRETPADGAAIDDAGLEAALQKLLRGAYDGLASGEHYKATGGDWLGGFKGPANLAKKLSAERVLHFKDADAWLRYNRKYGTGNLFDGVLDELRHAARNTALMETWGTNPRAMFDAVLADLRQGTRADWRAIDRLRGHLLQAEFAEVTGEANIPGNITFATVGSVSRSIESMAKLGGAVVSSLTDLPVMAASLKHNGVGLLEGYGTSMGALLSGRRPDEVREIADMLGVGFDGVLGRIAGRFDATDALPGQMSKLQSLFFRLNGLTWWTDSLKEGAGLVLSSNLARHAGKDLAALPEALRVTLDAYGIGEREWRALNAADHREAHGRAYVLADDLDRVADDVLDQLLAPERADLQAAFDADIKALVEQVGALDARAPEIAARFEARLAQGRERLMARIDQMTEGRDKAVAALDARLDLLRAKAERRWIQMHLDDTAKAQDMTRTLGRRLDEAEAAGRLSGVYRRRIMDTAREAGRNRVSAGRADGRRLADAERRVKEVEARVKTADAEFAARAQAAHDDFVARWTNEQTQALAAIERVGERRADVVDRIMARAEAFGLAQDRLREGFRRETQGRLRTYFAEEVDTAVVTPGARERAFMRQGQKPGTAAGEVLRFFWQFKGFPLAFTNKVLGRQVYARGDRRLLRGIASGRWGLIHIILATTVFGYMAGSAKDLLKGKVPRDPNDPRTWVAAFIQGGGAGIFGDFLFGEYSRFGKSATSTLAGPVAGLVDDLAALYAAARNGDDVAARALRTALSHTPFVNLFYTRMALDYLVLYQVQEALNPGYLRRLERRMQKDSGQTFLMPPSRAIPRGGGDRLFEGVRP